MVALSAVTGDCANSGAEQLFGENDPAVRALTAVMRKLHKHFKDAQEKPIPHIAARARVGTRAVEYWHGGKQRMSGEALISLVMSDVGGEVLEAAMASLPARDRPHWWLGVQGAREIAQLRRDEADMKEKLRSATDNLAQLELRYSRSDKR